MAIQILINFKLENAQSSKKSTHKKNQSGNKNDLYLEKNDGEGILWKIILGIKASMSHQ